MDAALLQPVQQTLWYTICMHVVKARLDTHVRSVMQHEKAEDVLARGFLKTWQKPLTKHSAPVQYVAT